MHVTGDSASGVVQYTACATEHGSPLPSRMSSLRPVVHGLAHCTFPELAQRVLFLSSKRVLAQEAKAIM